MRDRPQPAPCDAVKEYDVAIIVAGSRHWADDRAFDFYMRLFTSRHVKEGKRIIFISGAAKTGADRLVINWCASNEYAWTECPADWEKYKPTTPGRGNPAGHIRNREMAVLAKTAPDHQLIAFWDLASRGTKGMIDIAVELKIFPCVVAIDIHPE